MLDICAHSMKIHTLCSTGNLFAHHCPFFAFGLIIAGLVVLD